MKKYRIITVTALVLQIISMILVFLALSDIGHDFVGSSIVVVESLPNWTNCQYEWLIIQIDYAIRILFIFAVLYDIWSSNKNRKSV